ncbi:efflux transporter outer membrane subunit [bacterium]|nr:efflux transporter outer membrane subunit [bacterium]
MKISLHTFVLSACVTFFACTAKNPKADSQLLNQLPQDYEQAPSDVPRSDVDLVAWWKTFNDPLLTSLVERAVLQNHDLRIAIERVEQVLADKRIARAHLFPTISIQGGYEKSKASRGTLFVAPPILEDPVSESYLAGLNFDWEIDLFGRVRNEFRAARASAQAVDEARRGVLISLIAEVVRTYAELRANQIRLNLARENILALEESVEVIRTRQQAGLSSELDLARAETELSTEKSVLPTWEAQVAQNMHRLSVLLGQMPNSLASELMNPTAIPQGQFVTGTGIPADLLKRRPDIRQADFELAAQVASAGAAKADFFPTISLTGSLGRSSIDYDTLNDSTSQFWSFGPQLRWPIFSGGKLLANIRKQNSKLNQAMLQYEQVVIRGLEETENTLINLRKEGERRAQLEHSFQTSKHALSLAEEQYEYGLIDLLAVIDARRKFVTVQDQLQVSKAQETQHLVMLYKALGGGWEQFEQAKEAVLNNL